MLEREEPNYGKEKLELGKGSEDLNIILEANGSLNTSFMNSPETIFDGIKGMFIERCKLDF